MMPEYIENMCSKRKRGKVTKNMCLRRNRGKNTILWCPKNTYIFNYCLKSQYYDARKYYKYHVFKTWPSQNHATMMPKNGDFFFFIFKLKSSNSAARKFWKIHVLKMWLRQNHYTMIPKKYIFFFLLLIKITIL